MTKADDMLVLIVLFSIKFVDFYRNTNNNLISGDNLSGLHQGLINSLIKGVFLNQMM